MGTTGIIIIILCYVSKQYRYYPIFNDKKTHRLPLSPRSPLSHTYILAVQWKLSEKVLAKENHYI